MINKDVMVHIVFPVHNRLKSTKDILASLSKQSAQNYNLVICDDGSTDGTGEYLSTHHPDVTVIQGNGQLWWTAGINKCVHYPAIGIAFAVLKIKCNIGRSYIL